MKNKNDTELNSLLELEDFYNTNKTEDTKNVYFNRAKQLIKRAKKDLDIPLENDLDLRQLVMWLEGHKKQISRSSWRQYKSSVIFYLEENINNQDAQESLEFLHNISSKGALKYTEKTSSLKLKKITLDDWNKIDNFLSIEQKKWYPELRHWLRASIITGLRPVEWKNAELIEYNGEIALKIQNAKNTNGRSHGDTRTLVLKNVSHDDMHSIKTHIYNINTFIQMDSYNYFYNGCAIALYKACRKCWPRRKRHITLYSTRHQFSANAKSSGFSRAEIAALMGHAVDITATIHYGRKQAGYETLGISPIEDDVSRVRHIEGSDIKSINSQSSSQKTEV